MPKNGNTCSVTTRKFIAEEISITANTATGAGFEGMAENVGELYRIRMYYSHLVRSLVATYIPRNIAACGWLIRSA
jgi:hypothetical protein